MKSLKELTEILKTIDNDNIEILYDYLIPNRKDYVKPDTHIIILPYNFTYRHHFKGLEKYFIFSRFIEPNTAIALERKYTKLIPTPL